MKGGQSTHQGISWINASFQKTEKSYKIGKQKGDLTSIYRKATDPKVEIKLYSYLLDLNHEYVSSHPLLKSIRDFQPKLAILETSKSFRGVPSGFVVSQWMSPE